MSGDHDLGYKQLFAHPELVRDLLAGFTQVACFRHLSVSALERVNGNFVSERYSERHGDMLWRVRLDDHVLYVYLLLEFQSHAERWMALRMQVYVGLLYQDLVKRRELVAGGTLPPVLPVVFYNGVAAWQAPQELLELVCVPPEGLGGFQPRQRYLLIDQRALDAGQLARERNLIAALFRLELSDSPQVLMEVLANLRTWLAGDEQAGLRRSIAGWIARLQQRELRRGPADVLALLEERDVGERFQRKFATWADYLEDQGRQKGLAEGRQEGRREAARGMLRHFLEMRFGPLSAETSILVEGANADQCERWAMRVLDARTIDEVFRG